MVELLQAPLGLNAGWPLIFCLMLLARAGGGALLMAGAALLAFLSVAHQTPVTELFPAQVLVWGPRVGLGLLLLGAASAVLEMLLGQNLKAAFVLATVGFAAKLVGQLLFLPFRLLGARARPPAPGVLRSRR